MKPAEPERDYRSLVRSTYDHIAQEFNRARATDAAEELAQLLDVLRPGSTVLDLGCGSGVPIAKALSESHDLIGVDLSGAQLANAGRQAPGAQFVQADMASCAFLPASFDAVVSFYAIFHLPLTEHGPLISRISEWLRPGGYFLATFSPVREEGYVEDFFGEEMYWSNLGLPEYRTLLAESGFQVLSEGAVGHGYSDVTAKPERHPLILARRHTGRR
jgi:cyclopropane fatty-acyl-phospholipid synthase-like methyltransferase